MTTKLLSQFYKHRIKDGNIDTDFDSLGVSVFNEALDTLETVLMWLEVQSEVDYSPVMVKKAKDFTV